MNKKKYAKIIIVVLVVSVVFSACGIPGVTEPFGVSEDLQEKEKTDDKDNKIENTKKNTKHTAEITDNIDETKYIQRYFTKEKQIYKVGDVVTPVRPLGDNDNTRYMRFKVKSATVYDHVSDAGLDESLIYDNWELFDGECGYVPRAVKNEESMKARFLLCDMEFDYDREYLDCMNTDNVTEYSLIYVQDDGRYVVTGYPIYHSARDLSKAEYNQNDFEVHEETVNIQIGWVIDKDIFEVDKFDLGKLYICTAALNEDEECREYVDLGLED